MRRSVLGFVLLAVCPLGLDAQARHEFTEVHMGVPVRVVLYVSSDGEARSAARAAFGRIAALEGKMSGFRGESELRALERRAGAWVEVSGELFDVLALALEVARASDGAFDPTVGPLTELWREARRSGRLPDPKRLAATRRLVDWRRVELDSTRRAVRLVVSGMRLDLSGIAKGYILQEALRTLGTQGIKSALVEAGGDLVVGAAPPGTDGWRIETPTADSAVARRASALTHAAIATSGASEQFVEIGGVRYAHVVDLRTGLGLTTPYTATVIARDGALADALATALTVLGPESGPELIRRYRDVVASVQLP